MGINAQTSVPKFTAGDTLTAANTNLLANGIPVFGGTALRDASFGGSGEKVLAEGQFAYLEDTNTTQFYDGAAWVNFAAAKLGQVVTASVTAALNTTSTSFVTTNLTATITPTSTSSQVIAMYSAVLGSPSGNSAYLTIFRGTVAGTNLGGGSQNCLTQQYSTASGTTVAGAAGIVVDSPATSSAQVYTVGIKASGGTAEFNVGSQNKCTLTLIEVLA